MYDIYKKSIRYEVRLLRKQIAFRLPVEMHEEISALAKRLGVSVNALIVQAVRKLLLDERG